jgi:outer membrane immunogenic protein
MRQTLFAAAAALCAAITLAPAASAQLYGGVGYNVFQADTTNGDNVDLGTVMGRLGWQFNPLFSVEGEAAVGVQDQDYSVLGTTVHVGVDNELGAFAVGHLPIPFVADLYGRIGYATISLNANAGSAQIAQNDGSGLAYGGGVEFNVLLLRFRAEYTRYEVDHGNIDSLGVSALLHF